MTAVDRASMLVLAEREGGVAWLTLNRPARHNSLVPELLEALLEHLEGLGDAAGDLRAVVLRANGPSFSTGGDVKAFYEQGADAGAYADRLVGLLNRAVLGLMALPVPVIGRVHGPVTGGAIGLVLACDLVAVTPEVFIAPYYVDVGFSPDGGWSAILPDRIGRLRALEIQLLNRPIGAQEAVALGLATRVVGAEELDGQITAWLDALAAKVPGSLRRTRERLLDPVRATYAEGLEAERRAFVEQIATPEARSGMARFLGLGEA